MQGAVAQIVSGNKVDGTYRMQRQARPLQASVSIQAEAGPVASLPSSLFQLSLIELNESQISLKGYHKVPEIPQRIQLVDEAGGVIFDLQLASASEGLLDVSFHLDEKTWASCSGRLCLVTQMGQSLHMQHRVLRPLAGGRVEGSLRHAD